ncbi:hypothetical protein HK096_006508, partial [Nowakowskiella sp. JEL0078]
MINNLRVSQPSKSQEMAPIKKKGFAGQVTSLVFIPTTVTPLSPYTTTPPLKLLLTTSGPYLRIYNPSSSTLLHVVNDPLGIACKVHQFISLSEHGLGWVGIFGGKRCAFLKMEFEESDIGGISVSVSQQYMGQFSDCIQDAIYIKSDEYTESLLLAVAFAHNFVELWDINKNICIRKVQCEERCILYSARFFGNRLENLLLASGTVFNQVLIWNPFVGEPGFDGLVFARLQGHEGVIFNLRFNKMGDRLASVSDDRSIRIWKVQKDNLG